VYSASARKAHPLDCTSGWYAERLEGRSFGPWFRLLCLIWRFSAFIFSFWMGFLPFQAKKVSDSSRAYREGRNLSVGHAGRAFCGTLVWYDPHVLGFCLARSHRMLGVRDQCQRLG